MRWQLRRKRQQRGHGCGQRDALPSWLLICWERQRAPDYGTVLCSSEAHSSTGPPCVSSLVNLLGLTSFPSHQVSSTPLMLSPVLRAQLCSSSHLHWVSLTANTRAFGFCLLLYMDNKQEASSMQSDAPRRVLPPSATHPTREAHKKYIEAITNMKNATKLPTISTPFQDNTPKDHPFKAEKYIFEYIKKGIPHAHVYFVHKEEGTSIDNSKEI